MPPLQTGWSCPDCPGVLSGRTEGSAGHIQFECRVGHTFSLRGLLESKEARVAVLSLRGIAVALAALAAGEPIEAEAAA